jgi:aminoacyl tRNA synthase complex-interacting multifunctional protein 1
MNAVDLLDEAIAELEARLNLKPGQDVPARALAYTQDTDSAVAKGQTAAMPNKKGGVRGAARKPPAIAAEKKGVVDDVNDLPAICKMEFKVGVIIKVWVHESADTLYCEEIDVGEPTGPRQIASGLRHHFTLEQMLGQRLLVVANLKARNLVGFKSHGMVLCAAASSSTNADGKERVEFVEPPPGAVIGEIVTFADLPPPQPAAPSQVEKQKIFAQCAAGLATTSDRVAVWNGHAFTTSAGPCTAPTIAGGVLR